MRWKSVILMVVIFSILAINAQSDWDASQLSGISIYIFENANATNLTVNCTNILGAGNDTNFCTDATGAGGGGYPLINTTVLYNDSGQLGINWSFWNITGWNDVLNAYWINISRWNNATDNVGSGTDTRHEINTSEFDNSTGELGANKTWLESFVYQYSDDNCSEDGICPDIAYLGDLPTDCNELAGCVDYAFNNLDNFSKSRIADKYCIYNDSGSNIICNQDPLVSGMTVGKLCYAFDNGDYIAVNCSLTDNRSYWDEAASIVHTNMSDWNNPAAGSDTRHLLNYSDFRNDTGVVSLNYSNFNFTEWNDAWQSWSVNLSRWNNATDNTDTISFPNGTDINVTILNASKINASKIKVYNLSFKYTFIKDNSGILEPYKLSTGAVGAWYGNFYTYKFISLGNGDTFYFDKNTYDSRNFTFNSSTNTTIFNMQPGDQIGFNSNVTFNYNVTLSHKSCNSLDTDSNGFIICGEDATGSGGNALSPINLTEFDNTTVLTLNRTLFNFTEWNTAWQSWSANLTRWNNATDNAGTGNNTWNETKARSLFPSFDNLAGNVSLTYTHITGNLSLAYTAISGNMTLIEAHLATNITLTNTHIVGNLTPSYTAIAGNLTITNTHIVSNSSLKMNVTGGNFTGNIHFNEYNASGIECLIFASGGKICTG